MPSPFTLVNWPVPRCLVIAAAIGFVSVSAPQDVLGQQSSAGPDQVEISAAIKQLSSDKFKERQAAHQGGLSHGYARLSLQSLTGIF